jgi:hypothetical protein
MCWKICFNYTEVIHFMHTVLPCLHHIYIFNSSNSRQSFSSDEETDDGEHIDHDYNLQRKHINKGRWSRDEVR